MFNNLPGYFLLIFSFGLLTLYLREYYLRRKDSSISQKDLQDAKEKGLTVLNEAIKKSQEIIADSRARTQQMENGFQQELKQLNEQFKQSLTQSFSQSDAIIQETQKQFNDFLLYLRTQSEESQSMGQQQAEAKINQILGQLEARLTEFLVQSEQKTTGAIDLELRSARQLIDTYKSQQLALIDENVVAILERTLSLVLAKKLSLKEQVDLVYESLEKAKVEKFIV